MKFLYRLFLLILIAGGVSIGLYGGFRINIWDSIPTKAVFDTYTVSDLIRVLIGLSAIVVLFANFNISFKVKKKQ